MADPKPMQRLLSDDQVKLLAELQHHAASSSGDIANAAELLILAGAGLLCRAHGHRAAEPKLRNIAEEAARAMCESLN